jgi:hypothetical protein
MTSIAPAPATLREIRRIPEEPRPRRRHAPVDPVVLAVQMATAYVEVRSGRRPLPQLRDVLPRDAYRRLRWAELQQRHQPTTRRGASVHRIMTCRVAPDVVEVSVVVRDGDHARGVAVRMELHDRWRVADIGLPEDLPSVRRRGGS